MRKRRKAVRAPVGAAPGTLPATPHARPTNVQLYEYNAKTVRVTEGPDLAHLAAPPAGTHYWVNVEGLQDHGTLRRLGEIFKIHALALEDVLVSQRPKIEGYAHNILFLIHMPTSDCKVCSLEFEQVTILYGADFVVTFQDGHPGDCFQVVRKQLAEVDSSVRRRGPDYLAYRLLDAIIDSYFPLIDQIDERIERCEEHIFVSGGDVIAEVRQLKRDISELERRIRPVTESLRGRERYLDNFTTEETRLEIRDCLDHSRQLSETLANQKEFATGLIADYISALSYKTNEVMRALTIITTVFMPLTFIAGVYGMNFEHMPELKWHYGYPFTLLLMAAVAFCFWAYFRQRGWVGKTEAEPPPQHTHKPGPAAPVAGSVATSGSLATAPVEGA
jgi:magnesium transporter